MRYQEKVVVDVANEGSGVHAVDKRKGNKIEIQGMNELRECNLVLMGKIEQEINNIPCLDCDGKMGIDRL